jgi:hypothetical protein
MVHAVSSRLRDSSPAGIPQSLLLRADEVVE